LIELSDDKRETASIVEEAILSRQAGGMIINSRYISPQIERIAKKHNYPVICVGKPQVDTIFSWIDTNHALSSDLVVEHLVSCGCKKIAFMGGIRGEAIFEARLSGFTSAIYKYGAYTSDGYIVYNNADIRDIYKAARGLLSMQDRPEAIVCNESLLAVGTMNVIRDMGISVPKDISLIMFDDHPYSPGMNPAPTVIDIDLFSLGVQISNSILKIIAKPSLVIQTFTSLPRLVQRETTKLQ
jgi:LacI family transcriptional regulator